LSSAFLRFASIAQQVDGIMSLSPTLPPPVLAVTSSKKKYQERHRCNCQTAVIILILEQRQKKWNDNDMSPLFILNKHADVFEKLCHN